jgi:DNA-directed RNA polymerase specialized sigma24 family protein
VSGRTHQAIEQLYRDRFAGYCDALAAVSGNRDSARDAVQEAFARALRKRRRLRREQSLAPRVIAELRECAGMSLDKLWHAARCDP